MLNRAPEWRAFTFEDQQTRVRTGAPVSLQFVDQGLATTFQPDKDAQGRVLPFEKRQLLWRLRRWQYRARAHSSQERNLMNAMTELTRLADALNIPSDIRENAAILYRKALHHNLIRGRSIHAVVAASLYLACRRTQLPRKLSTFAHQSNRTLKEITRCYRLIHNALNIDAPIDDPEKYIPKIASNLHAPQHVQNTAIHLIYKAHECHAVEGKNPVAIAAAALYIAGRLEHAALTQEQVAQAADVTVVTIRNRYQGLARALDLDLVKSRPKRTS
jgi:transcription initiation factor TFIIB